jgi:hypothetical protein
LPSEPCPPLSPRRRAYAALPGVRQAALLPASSRRNPPAGRGGNARPGCAGRGRAFQARTTRPRHRVWPRHLGIDRGGRQWPSWTASDLGTFPILRRRSTHVALPPEARKHPQERCSAHLLTRDTSGASARGPRRGRAGIRPHRHAPLDFRRRGASLPLVALRTSGAGLQSNGRGPNAHSCCGARSQNGSRVRSADQLRQCLQIGWDRRGLEPRRRFGRMWGWRCRRTWRAQAMWRRAMVLPFKEKRAVTP